MPIDKSEFDSGKVMGDVEKGITVFLEKNHYKAFTMVEIMDGIKLQTTFRDLWKTIVSVIGTALFQLILNNLVTSGRIRQNIIQGTVYYMAK